ncbi:MAG TPA: extracellular solute-binding protein [Chloroflexia bacterium]|nr:extracellular solute-binding protein [Chloroflexia bacterium]
MKLFKQSGLAMLVIMMMLVTACGGADPTATVPAAAPTTAPAAVNTPTTGAMAPTTMPAAATPATGGAMMPKVTGALTVWHSYTSGGSAEVAAFQKGLDQFKKDNPEATVTVLDVPFDQLFNKFETEAAAGGGPDMFIAPNDSLGKEVRAGLLMQLDDKLKGHLDNDLQVAVDGSKVDGKLYAVPESLKAVAMFYNKDKVTKPPATTDELMTAVKGGLKFGINQGAYHNWGFYNAFGGTIFDASGKSVAATTGVADAFQYLKDLKAAGAQFFTDGSKLDEAFQNKALDGLIEGPWKTGDFKKALGASLGVAPMPAGPKGPSMPMTGVDGWYINANTKNVDNAVNFALYMVSPTVEQIFVDEAGHIPADKTLKISDPITQGFATAVANGFPRPQTPELDNYWGNFGDAFNKIMDKDADVKATTAEADAATNKANKK